MTLNGVIALILRFFTKFEADYITVVEDRPNVRKMFAVYVDSIFDKVRRCNFGCNLKWFCLSITLYEDDILLLAPTVSSLQQLLHICETELIWFDMSINVNKSSCLRVSPRYNSLCSNLTTLDGREITRMNKVRYLGVHLTS